MLRLNKIEKSRKPLSCGRCKSAIPVGSPYFWFAAFRSPKQVRCEACRPTSSDLASNDTERALIDLEALTGGSFETKEEIATACEDIVAAAESARDDAQEKFDNLPENFQNGEQGERLQAVIDDLENTIQEADAAKNTAEDSESEFEDALSDYESISIPSY